MDTLQLALARNAEAIGGLLDRLQPARPGAQGRVVEAMRYAALNGGKRLRPFLTVERARLFGVPESYALRAGTALEMVHCYSLVHDDLPAMDDSDLRRGQPTVHIEFDEAVAILADPETHPDPAIRAELIAGLAAAAGADGMVGGQMIDMSPERNDLDLAGITELQSLKTGALITFACEAGAILGQASVEERQALVGFAQDLGLAFQIVDDLLDAEGSAAELGKPTGQDAAMGKATFVGQLGREGARQRAEEIVARAHAQLALFGERAELLCLAASFVLQRRS